MGTRRPHTLNVPISCAPRKAPCPSCGRLGRRKQVLRRTVRTLEYRRIAHLDITYGEYRARCACRATFRTHPPGVDLRDRYDDKVRRAVLDRILDDRMSVEAARASLRRDFLLELSDGFVYDCLREHAEALDMADYRRWTLEGFSGTLCIDELHLGRFTLLLATDPLRDRPVAFALVDRNDADHMRRFLKNLKAHGFSPNVIVTDGSPLYPALLAELWPDARHQLCVFHVLKDINAKVLEAVRRLRRQMARRGNRGRKRRRGRPAKARVKRKGMTNKEKAHYVFKRRFLIVKRRDNLTEQERDDLATMLAYLPELEALRSFVDRVYGLFEDGQSPHRAKCRWAALLRSAEFAAVPELVGAMGMLTEEKFAKMIAFLASPAGQRIRTNNHVERTNRRLRFLEKVRYKWRRRRTLVRFVVLTLDLWRRNDQSDSRVSNSGAKAANPPDNSKAA
jgi:transposase-like protein